MLQLPPDGFKLKRGRRTWTKEETESLTRLKIRDGACLTVHVKNETADEDDADETADETADDASAASTYVLRTRYSPP